MGLVKPLPGLRRRHLHALGDAGKVVIQQLSLDSFVLQDILYDQVQTPAGSGKCADGLWAKPGKYRLVKIGW
jgi:hypothetical protein